MLQVREIRESDTHEQPFVAVVSSSFVQRYWPRQDPLGRTFTFGLAERTIVGVAGGVKVRGLERTSEPQVYLPHPQVADSSLIGYVPKDLAVRANGDPMRLVPAIREIIRRADPSQPVASVQTLAEIVFADTASRRVQLRMVGALAALAFLLAALGFDGLLSFTATHRGHEIGLRIPTADPLSFAGAIAIAPCNDDGRQSAAGVARRRHGPSRCSSTRRVTRPIVYGFITAGRARPCLDPLR